MYALTQGIQQHSSVFPTYIFFSMRDSVELHVPCCSVCMVESSCLITLKSRDLTPHSCIREDISCVFVHVCTHAASSVEEEADGQVDAVGRPPLSHACTGPRSCGTPVNYNVIIITSKCHLVLSVGDCSYHNGIF